MNPQDQAQNTSAPEDTFGGARTTPVTESPSMPQARETNEQNVAAFQAIEPIEAEPISATPAASVTLTPQPSIQTNPSNPIPTAAPAPSGKKPSSKKGLIIVLGIVLVLAVAVGGFFIYQSLNKDPSPPAETSTVENEARGDLPGGNETPVKGSVNN